MNSPASTTTAEYTAFLRRRWRAVLAGLALGTAAAGVFLAVVPPRQVATAEVLVVPLATDTAPTTEPVRLINLDTEAQLVRSATVVAAARRALGAGSGDLAGAVSLSAPTDTTILRISFEAPTRTAAVRGADAFARAYLDARQAQAEGAVATRLGALRTAERTVRTNLQDTSRQLAAPAAGPDQDVTLARRGVLARQLEGQVLQLQSLTGRAAALVATPVVPGRVLVPAAAPARPVAPLPEVVVPSGLLAGLLLGLFLAAVRERLDRRVRGAAALAACTGVPSLGVLRADPRRSADGLRRLGNWLLHRLDTGPPRRMLVVATASGHTTVATGLAGMLVRSGRPAVLVLPGDPLPAAGDELVIVEMPADGEGTDTRAIAREAGAVVLVADLGETTRADLAAAARHLARLGLPADGTVAVLR